MDAFHSELKKISLKSGKIQMTKSQYLDLLKMHHKSIDIKKNNEKCENDKNNILKNNNEKKNINKIISSSQEKEKMNIPSQQNKKNSLIFNLKDKIIKEHKKTNSLQIEFQLSPHKFFKKNIKIMPKKRQLGKAKMKEIRNYTILENINSIEEASKENIDLEQIIQNEKKEKDNTTSSTNNDSFENLDTIIINSEDNRKIKYFVKTSRNKLKHSSSNKNFNTFDYESPNYNNYKCKTSRNNYNYGLGNINYFHTLNSSNINNLNFKSNDLFLNIEDLIMIEDKLSKLLKTISEKNIKFINRICFELWNYYFNCTFKGNCDYLFTETRNKNVVNCYNSFLLISVMLIYDLSFNPKFFIKLIDYIKKIFLINHQNYLIICQYLISRIKSEYLNSKYVEQLKEIIQSQISKKQFFLFELEQNLQSLNKLLAMIINIFNNNNLILNSKISLIYKNYNQYDSDTINKIFMTDIIRIENKVGSLLYSTRKTSYPIITDSYFITTKPTKNLTLVLDLDETLMSFIFINYEKKEGLTRIRPYLYNFLNLVKEYYEIIIFTAATKNYADPILDVIEEIRGKYFNYRLYREHCSIIDNDFIKDISLIGRDLSKMIIVDNMQQNFKLQKENGILISSFWGEDDNDKVLLQLGKILVSIAIDMIESDFEIDIRDELKKYKEDILKNISMN